MNLIPDAAALEAQISDLKDAWLRDIRAHQDMCPATFSNCVPHDCGCGLTELREAEMDKIEKLNSPPAKAKLGSGTSLSEGAKALDVTSRERPAFPGGEYRDDRNDDKAEKTRNEWRAIENALRLRKELDPDAPDAVVIEGDPEFSLADLDLWFRRVLDERLKYRNTTRSDQPVGSGYTYVEIPEWELRQKRELVTQAVNGLSALLAANQQAYDNLKTCESCNKPATVHACHAHAGD